MRSCSSRQHNTKVGVYEGDRLRVFVAAHEAGGSRRPTSTASSRDPAAHARHRAAADRRRRHLHVVPPVQQTLEWMCEKYFDVVPYSSSPERTSPCRSPSTTRARSARRITKSVAAAALYGPPLIVGDLAPRPLRLPSTPRASSSAAPSRRASHTSTEALIARARACTASSWCARRRRSGATPSPHPVRRRYGYAGLVEASSTA